MPLTGEQRRIMDIHIKANTVYNWHVSGMESEPARKFIISSMERLVDSKKDMTRDLFLPDCFIDGCENSTFWYRIASILSGDAGVKDWHELEWGGRPTQRYVYTWTLGGESYRFYTKRLCSGYVKELVWYIGKSCGGGSDDDTDTEDVMLQVYP